MPSPEPAHSPAALYLASLSEGSRRTMAQSLRAVIALADLGGPTHTIDTMPWPTLDYATFVQVRAAIARRYRPATANKTLSALRGVLLACKRLRRLSAEDFDQRREWLAPIKGTSLPKGRALTTEQLAAILACCTDEEHGTNTAPTRHQHGTRDAAILALLYGAGLRRSELCGLDLQDYDPTAGVVNVRKAKGNKQRRIRLLTGTSAWLNQWLTERGTSTGPLFPRVVGQQARLTGDQIFAVLQRRAMQAGLGHLTPHDLRRTFVTHLLDAKNDLATVQRMAGHARPETTIRYDRRPEDAERVAAQSVSVPPPVG